MRRPYSWVGLAIAMVATARPAYPQAWQPRVATDSTLRSLIDEAIQRNPGLAQRQAVAQAATMRIRPAGTIADPVLSLGVMDLNLPNFRRSDFSEIDAEVRQEFPWPGTLRFRSGVARAGADMARAEVGARRREITTAVAEVYYRLRYLATALGILDRQRRLLSAGWDLSNTRYATGAAPQSDPLLARVARDRLDAEDAALRGDYDAAWATLNALRVRPSSDTTGVRPFDLADLRAHIAPLPPVDSLVVLAVSNHPTVAARRAVVAQAGTTIRLERLGALPDFSFAVRYGYRGTVGGVPLPDFLSAFVGVRLPIWAGRKQYRLADAARADSAGAESALREEEARLTQEVSEIAARATAAQRRLALLLDGVLPAARAAVESGQRSYQVGKAEFLTVLTAEDALFRAEIEAASVAAEHQTHLVMLAELTAEENQP